MQNFKKKILIFLALLLSLSSFAQNLNLSFRLYDKDGKLISPFRFETEVECYSKMQQQNALVLQKRLKFDERTYYYLYQTEWVEGQVEELFFISNHDTLSLKLEKLATNNIVIDQIRIQQGMLMFEEHLFNKLETVSKPEQKEYTYWTDKIEPKAFPKWMDLPKRLRRLRFSNFMQILHSRG